MDPDKAGRQQLHPEPLHAEGQSREVILRLANEEMEIVNINYSFGKLCTEKIWGIQRQGVVSQQKAKIEDMLNLQWNVRYI